VGEPIRTPVGMMWIDEAGLLWHRLDFRVTVRMEHVAGIHEAMQKLANGSPVRAVVDISGVQFADREARDAFARPIDDSSEVATALIVQSAISRAMGTLFLKLSRPSRPVKLFLDEDEVARWVASVPAFD
jgi:hypothetical protein